MVWWDNRDDWWEIYYKRGWFEQVEVAEDTEDVGYCLGASPSVIRYSIPQDNKVYIIISDIVGRRVRILLSGSMNAGNYRFNWNGCDDQGNPLPEGVYFCQLRVGGHSLTRKLILLE